MKGKSDVGASSVARLPMMSSEDIGRAADGSAAFPKAASKGGTQFAEKAGTDVG